ncbi:MAG: M3 family metallopeptidase [Rikenellaceae bacterium]
MTNFKSIIFTMMTSTLAFGCVDSSMPKVDYPDIDTTNPLLSEWTAPHAAPPFSEIKVEDFAPAFDAAIEYSRAELKAIIENPAKPTFKNTIVALERQGQLLDRVSGVFYPLLHANTSPEMEQLSLDVQPKLTQLGNDISLNAELFERVKSVYNNPPSNLSVEDKRLLEECYKGFARSGAALSEEDKALYRDYTTELGRLTIEFGQNILAATNAFAINITDASQVKELPESLREALAATAKERGEKGWSVTLHAPSYIPFLTYSSRRELKEKLWRAYSSRSLAGKSNNTANILRIVELRLLIANLLGFETYADYALDNRMAQTRGTVEEFLAELLEPTKEFAVRDYNRVVEYAQKDGFTGAFQPWDFPYWAEKYKNAEYSISDEEVKPYLSLSSVREGIFLLANKLYNINFTPAQGVDTYHEDVEVFEVRDNDGEFISLLYLDFFPRSSKSAGAWMTEFRGADGSGKDEVRPLVTLVMNFTKPTESHPSLLTYNEFETFLHEFGHALHGMLARGEYGSLNGTNVYRDFVELPSQLLENWATKKEFLDMWASHYTTGEKIPAELVAKIERAANYNAAYAHVRQLQFGLLDMAWHTLTEPYTGDIESFERKATAPTQILPLVDGACFSPSFSHIFNGGYAAGYYGYKWAEVLEADAFSIFEREGIFNKETARRFRENILERGGQENPMDLYIRFSGAKPSTKALIERTIK